MSTLEEITRLATLKSQYDSECKAIMARNTYGLSAEEKLKLDVAWEISYAKQSRANTQLNAARKAYAEGSE